MASVVPIVIHIRARAERLHRFRADNAAALAPCAGACADAIARAPADRLSRERPDDPFLVFDAIKHRVGYIGCKQSHRAVALICRALAARGLATLVMEDDAVCKIPAGHCAALLRRAPVPGVDLMNLGPAYMNGRRHQPGPAAPRPFALDEALDVWAVPIKYASLAHSILVMPHFAEAYARCMAESPDREPADDAIRAFMDGRRLFSAWPVPFWQRPGASDIANKHRDMDDAMRSSDALLRFILYRDVVCRQWTRPIEITDCATGSRVEPAVVTFAECARAPRDVNALVFVCPETMPVADRAWRAKACAYAAARHAAHAVCVQVFETDRAHARALEEHDIRVGVGTRLTPLPAPVGAEVARIRPRGGDPPDRRVREHGFLTHASCLYYEELFIMIIPYFGALDTNTTSSSEEETVTGSDSSSAADAAAAAADAAADM